MKATGSLLKQALCMSSRISAGLGWVVETRSLSMHKIHKEERQKAQPRRNVTEAMPC